MFRFKLDQNIDVAIRRGIVCQDGPKQSQLPDVVTTAEFRNFFLRNMNVSFLQTVQRGTLLNLSTSYPPSSRL